jgi:signal transduction histidine kinase
MEPTMQRRHLFTLVLATAAALSLVPSARAEERGTKEEAKAMTDAAFDHIKKVGIEKAAKDFTSDKAAWTKKDLYVILFDLKGTFQGHGANEKLVGRDMSNMKDASGKLIYAAMMETVNKGPGWVDYEWANPVSKKVEGKSTYVRKTPGGDGLVGVGIYR